MKIEQTWKGAVKQKCSDKRATPNACYIFTGRDATKVYLSQLALQVN